MVRPFVVVAAVMLAGCTGKNPCEKQVQLEEDCFSEFEQADFVDNDDCQDARREAAKCALDHKDDYCDYYLWQNRGAARLEGYTVADYLPPGNAYAQCIEGLSL